jgi:hypothetical protein
MVPERGVILQLSSLSWTAYGDWASYRRDLAEVSRHDGIFFTGFQTPADSVPTVGTATYTGRTTGIVWNGGFEGVGTAGMEELNGKVSLQANFATRIIDGALTEMGSGDPFDGSFPWNSVAVTGVFSGGQSTFAGTATAISTTSDSASLKANATGTLLGSFFGPFAQEVGGVWTLTDGMKSASGAFGASQVAVDERPR